MSAALRRFSDVLDTARDTAALWRLPARHDLPPLRRLLAWLTDRSCVLWAPPLVLVLWILERALFSVVFTLAIPRAAVRLIRRRTVPHG